jgi:hypothetical protein
MANRRAFPWRYALQLLGTVLSIGGGLVAVSTPQVGGIVFGLGLLALIGGSCE